MKGRRGLDGRLEAVLDGIAVGWAYDWSEPSSRVEIEILVDGRPVARTVADVPRHTLTEAGLDDARHGFNVELPSRLRDGGLHLIAATFSTSGGQVDASGAFRTSVSPAAEEWTGTRFLATRDGADGESAGGARPRAGDGGGNGAAGSDTSGNSAAGSGNGAIGARRALRLRASHQAQFTRSTAALGFAGGDAPETILLSEQTEVTRSQMLRLAVQPGVADPAGERERRLREYPPRYLAGRLLVSRLPGALVDTNRYLICPTERQYLVDSTRFRYPLPTWGYVHLGDDVYEREVAIEEREERVVVLGAQSNRNYSHWLLESVVRALLFRPFDDGSVMYLCPPLDPWQREALALAGVPEERLLITPPRRRRLMRFREVFAVSRGMWGIPMLIPDALSALASLGRPASDRRRLYVSRAGVQRRHITNEAELADVLERHGFETVHPQTLGVAEQIELFAGVEAVLGSFGSGLTNLIFSPPGTLAIELQPEELDFGGNAFVWHLASIREQRFAQVVCPVSDGMRDLPLSERDMTVDVPAIDELLGQLLG